MGDHTSLAAVLYYVGNAFASSSRDWSTCPTDAWLWGIFCGWDCEDTVDKPEHVCDDVCGGQNAMREVAALHGWTEGKVAVLRAHRAVVRDAVVAWTRELD